MFMYDTIMKYITMVELVLINKPRCDLLRNARSVM